MRTETTDAATAEHLTGRIALLLEETAHQGLLGLRLLMEARDLVTRVGADGDPATAPLIADLERRLVTLEREGRERLRRVRKLLRAGSAGQSGATRSLRSQR